jgi:L-threonylcarbamoyladenylate synthase
MNRLTTRVLKVDAANPDPEALGLAARVLLEGGLAAFATETVYGLGAIALDPTAVARIYEAKGRPGLNPVIVHVGTAEQARGCVAEWPEAAERLARQFWPGPLTLVLKRANVIPDIVTAGRETVAVRAPAGGVALGLIERTGQPLAAPSANRSSRLSPTQAAHVLADLDGRIDIVIDSGPTLIGLESTVLDLSAGPPRLLRPGPIGLSVIEQALGGLQIVEHALGASFERPASPGQLPVHYAPRTPAFRVVALSDAAGILEREDWGVVVLGVPEPVCVAAIDRETWLETPDAAARFLYETLHRYDSLGLNAIVVVMPPDRPEWEAVRDRVVRATRPLEELN